MNREKKKCPKIVYLLIFFCIFHKTHYPKAVSNESMKLKKCRTCLQHVFFFHVFFSISNPAEEDMLLGIIRKSFVLFELGTSSNFHTLKTHFRSFLTLGHFHNSKIYFIVNDSLPHNIFSRICLFNKSSILHSALI